MTKTIEIIMRIFKRIIVTSVLIAVVLIVAISVLNITGKQQSFMIAVISSLLKPDSIFDPKNMVNKPDYSKNEYWASLPNRTDEADLVPATITKSKNNGNSPVDVFYIHGTGYLNGANWTSPMNQNTATEDNAKFSLANEASIFNNCCNIFAPRYREASIFVYIALTTEQRDKVLKFVYQDISDAFDYFINNYNNGRPFIIVSHSQGTHHALRLIKKIDASPKLSKRLIVSYVIGSTMIAVSETYVNSLQNFTSCKNGKDIHCLVHWDTYGEGGTEKYFKSPIPSICINPLSWEANETRISSKKHLGAAPISGTYTIKLYGDDSTNGVVFKNMPAPIPKYSWAQCRNGILYVADQTGTEYAKLGEELPDKTYHGIDFPLFHMNIRQNVSDRIDTYFQNGVEND